MGRLGAALVSAPAALAVALLPLAFSPGRLTLATAAVAAALCWTGMILPAPALALAGAVVVELVATGALVLSATGDGLVASFALGVALLFVLVFAHARARGLGAPVVRAVLTRDLRHFARVVLAAAGASALAVAAGRALAWTRAPLPLLSVGGELLAFAAVVLALLAGKPKS